MASSLQSIFSAYILLNITESSFLLVINKVNPGSLIYCQAVYLLLMFIITYPPKIEAETLNYFLHALHGIKKRNRGFYQFAGIQQSLA